MEPINHNANHKACWSSRTKADHREGGRKKEVERERESEGKGERSYRQTCDNVWTWLVRWTMNLL